MVIFTVGCNYKCSFCHNKYLLKDNVGKSVSQNDVLKLINTNLLVKGVSISGGEPTLQADIFEYVYQISKTGKYISLDTNGSNPETLLKLIPHLNRVALDIKTDPLNQTKYEQITCVSLELKKVIKSFEILNVALHLDFEVRTTFVEKLMTPEDIFSIFEFLRNKNFRGNFVLQQFQYSEGVGEKFKESLQKPYHQDLIRLIEQYKGDNLSFDVFLRDDVVGYSKVISKEIK